LFATENTDFLGQKETNTFGKCQRQRVIPAQASNPEQAVPGFQHTAKRLPSCRMN
jgi:hypothetical protein